MAEAISVSGAFTRADGREATFQTGLLAPLAGASVTAQMGDTVVLVTATGAKTPREGADFFPLTVDVEERMYAAGRIPGSFFRREARAGEQAILTCRLIDRPLRPCFPNGFRNEVHVVATVLGADQSNPYDIAALNGASAALCLSPVPFDGPIGAVRLAWSSEGEWVPFPTYEQGQESAFEMVVAGRLAEDDVAVMMVEAGGTAATWGLYDNGAPKVDEDVLAGGLEASKVWIREMIELQQRLIDEAGAADKMEVSLALDHSDELLEAVRARALDRIASVQTIADKAQRQDAEAELVAAVVSETEADFGDDPAGGQAGPQRGPHRHQGGGASSHRHRRDPDRRPQDRRAASADEPRRSGSHRPRLGAVPTGRNAGAQLHHPGHRSQRHDDRRPVAH